MNVDFALIIFAFVGIPVLLTIFNVFLLFAEPKLKSRFKKIIAISDIMTFGLGVTYTGVLATFMGLSEWHEQLYVGEGTYTPVSFEHLATFGTVCGIAVLSYILLRFFGKKMPPIIAVVCYSGMLLGFFMTAVLTVQLWKNIGKDGTYWFLVFPYNAVLCSIRLMRNTVGEYAKTIAQREYTNPLLKLCQRVLKRASTFMLAAFVLCVPLLIITIAVLLLFGQQPDSIVKQFTETAEWTLSQKIPPPRLDYDAHYLCTVAACGDEKVVKPIRAGKRRGRLIVVNRQLLVANAFEDLIAERAPRLHKVIRKTYDKIGLPISKHINTKARSNAVYFIMKPLEWLFLLVLYTFDTKPENRIHRQYLG